MLSKLFFHEIYKPEWFMQFLFSSRILYAQNVLASYTWL
jgi:hypothetical protein